MSRLHHSYAGHLRWMQMSCIQLFVFVEGKHCDPYFFGNVCSVILETQVEYYISTARQIPGYTGGKQALIAFFDYLRKKRSLVTDLGGERTASIFFLDKDLDDLKRCKKRSPHIVYTEYYDVQNYIFQNGDLVKGAASAASVDYRRLEGDLVDSCRWCIRVATLWRDWVSLCLRLSEDQIPCSANYRVLSCIQTRYCGPTDPVALENLTLDIARQANISVDDLRRKFATTTSKVNRYYRRGEHHRIFKGKWFAAILADDVDRIMAGDHYDKNGLSSRITSAVAATLDFTEPWVEYFRNSISDVIAML